ncbi:hypothetical protein DPMN_154058 [Dreissena polymorpha]|uniref:Uncharacterized protein n=1 Tax=Dreissena polymorpha TaxID=45954 RepID=A0A9D4FKF3_DREPO|nr:hypothetical protein DPMN_154058 [Dreissena polymorpha]
MLKLAQTNQPTDQQTNQQTGQKQYVPHYYRAGGVGPKVSLPMGFHGAVVVFVFYRVHRDCLPYGHRPQKDVLIQETPRSRGDPGTYGGSNQRSLDCEASVLPLDHGSATLPRCLSGTVKIPRK